MLGSSWTICCQPVTGTQCTVELLCLRMYFYGKLLFKHLKKIKHILSSVSDPDPDPPGSACFWPVRIRIRRKCGSGSGSWLKMPISLTILQVFCLVDFSFFKFILKNAHFLNILVNFWVLWKNVENFHIPEFFFENFTLTIFINALDPDPDPDPDPGSGSGSASEF